MRKPASVRPAPYKASTLWTDIAPFLAVFVVAFGVRLFYLFQVESIPLFYHPVGDARSYDEWAQRIAAGDWLGQGVFYQAPLYPYFLGLLQVVLGRDLWGIRVVQIFLGAVSCSLLYGAGRSFFSRKAGVAAGLMLSLYAPALFFESLIQKAVLDLFFVALFLFLLGKIHRGSRWTGWVCAGIVLGLLGLARENALIWIFVAPVWIWFRFGEEAPRIRLGWMALFFGGLTLVLFPVGLRNLTVGGEFVVTTSQLGTNFFIGNNPEADGSYAPLRTGHGDPAFERQDATELAEQSLGRSLSPQEVSGYWLGRSWDYITSQPIEWLRLMGRKWMILWNVRELEDVDDFYIYQNWSGLLSLLGSINHFGLLAPLAAVGLALTWRQWRKLWLLYLLLGTLALSVALFYVLGRYRFSMIPLLALFAGVGITEGWTLYKEASFRRAVVPIVVLLLALVLVRWPVIGKPGPSAPGYNNLGNVLAKQGRADEARESFRRALDIDPNYAVPHYNLGNLLARQGKLEEAAAHYQKALKIEPAYAEAHNNLGNVLMARGELGDALQHFRRALELTPHDAQVQFNLGVILARESRLEEALGRYQQAIQINPDYAEAHHNMGIILATQGRLDKANDHFQQALRIRPEFVEAHEALGKLFVLQGRKEEAAQHHREALRLLKSRSEGHP